MNRHFSFDWLQGAAIQDRGSSNKHAAASEVSNTI
jgi:hypothetical protein